jgi:DNA-binding Lrp family transcriptional regulator
VTQWDSIDGELSKWDVVAALKKSGLPTSDRIIMMMLVDAADADTAIVPEQWTPSLTELAEWTGLGRSTVATRLRELERLGWVKRARPATADAIVRGARTCYHLAIGQAVEKVKPARTGGGRHGKPGSTAEPVQPLGQVNEAGSGTELVQALNQGGSAVEPLSVQPLNRTGSAVEHKGPYTHPAPQHPRSEEHTSQVKYREVI